MKKTGFVLILVFLMAGCGTDGQMRKGVMEQTETVKGGTMKLASPAFQDNGFIPALYTADGKDISPPLTIEGVPENARSLALVMDDPDAPMGTWDHWIIWNISPQTRTIEEGRAPQGIKGKNDFGKLEYGGPAPPSGTHTYLFKLYALDKMLDLKQGATKEELEKAMKGHILQEAVLKGKYSR